ncbi:MAG TPA: gephyrin-like molybdotransferase Glp [Bacillota bacterium]|nr:gephyrin-like molybdotransferase Glp [Bacillota bacterium]
MDFLKVISPAEALQRLRAAVPGRPAGGEELELLQALGRVTAFDTLAADAVPGFVRSTVDGYAVRARDTFGAGPEQPAYFELNGQVIMGRRADREVLPGMAVHVPTGGMVPPGADAVVMLEYATHLGDGDTLEVVRPVAPGENVMAAGEDFARGAVVVPAARRLLPADLGALAAAGIRTVVVQARPRVAILSTGDELVPVDEEPGPGQVREVNSVTLAASVVGDGGHPLQLGIVPDREDRLAEAVTRACRQADLVLLSGGSSVGKADLVPAVLAKLGQVLAHGLAVKPGKPTALAVCEGVPVIGLPGHPVSALVVYAILVGPFLRFLAGERGAYPAPGVRARLTRNLPVRGGVEEHVRVLLAEGESGWDAEPLPGKSGAISSLTRADGLVRVPASRRGLNEGEEVEVRLLRR